LLLQLALDDPDHIGLARELCDLIDIVEVGTHLLKRFGLSAIATIREHAGDQVPVLVDSKTVDGGARESEMIFRAGARFMTVLSNASAATHEAVNGVAAAYGGHIVADTIADARLPDKPRAFPDRFAYLALHAATDSRLAGQVETGHIGAVPHMHALGYRVALAGGIGHGSLEQVMESEPEILVVGTAITQSPDPRKAAEWIRRQLRNPGLGWPS
jgi:3-hexulose-6-phosphate synthase